MLNKHFLDFLKLLESHKVEFVVVGGYAVGIHGFPRYTGDLDVFVAISRENAARLVGVFKEYGFASLNLKPEDFLEADMVVEIGREPIKIQVLTGIDGVSFEQCRNDRILLNIAGTEIPFIGFDSLLANKAASPRNKDRIDLEELTRIRDLQRDRGVDREIE
jgi:predicted nucleotidyltransferase